MELVAGLAVQCEKEKIEALKMHSIFPSLGGCDKNPHMGSALG